MPAFMIEPLFDERLAQQLDDEGYAILPGLLSARHILDHPLAPQLARWHEVFYRGLYPLANRWNQLLDISDRYPAALDDFLEQNRQAGQCQLLSGIARLAEQGYQALTQHAQGPRTFPMQVVALLSEPGRDFTGGEFVMVEQRPRMQSRPMVLPLRCGDVAVIATAARPVKGARGYYRVNLRHAISRVHSGERIGLELVLHRGKAAQS